MDAVDTNILLYAHDPRDPRKQRIAVALIESLSDGVLLWQVACEYLAASRKLAPLGYDLAKAWADLEDLRQVWTTVLPDWSAMDRAHELFTRFGLSFWDAMVLGASLEAGARRLYTEDFGEHVRIEGFEIVNPFLG